MTVSPGVVLRSKVTCPFKIMFNKTKVIDLFAGPGGLGEGFSAYQEQGHNPFEVAVSIEKESYAHQTLLLRSFFRKFHGETPSLYYDILADLRRPVGDRLAELYAAYPDEAEAAAGEAWQATLGEDIRYSINERIATVINDSSCVLVGGPPCQAYSIAGRSRNRANAAYIPEEDKKHFLYREYLYSLARHKPLVFVLENVKGLLTSTINNERIFDQMLKDLREPQKALRGAGEEMVSNLGHMQYRIFSLVDNQMFTDESVDNYIIPMEDYGIPQSRHRVILLGIREDLGDISPSQLKKKATVSVEDVIGDLPPLRSGLSREEDTPARWRVKMIKAPSEKWFTEAERNEKLLKEFSLSRQKGFRDDLGRGAEFVAGTSCTARLCDWYADARIQGFFNHSTRAHIVEDLYRYYFCACYAKAEGRSPSLRDFPQSLLPNHKNVDKALNGSGMFSDRFRVQVADRPSSTITCHIAKDGHYYIHPDPNQCRSLTVREAARLQTFPDNYFFCGNRTQQYEQVGNAVPPLLSSQIAEIVYEILQKAGATS